MTPADLKAALAGMAIRRAYPPAAYARSPERLARMAKLVSARDALAKSLRDGRREAARMVESARVARALARLRGTA